MGAAEKKDDSLLVTLTVSQLRALVREEVNDAIGTSSDDQKWLTLEQVADMLQVTTKTVRAWVRDEGLPASKAGPEYRFRKDLVLSWLEERAVKPGVDKSKSVARIGRLKAK